MKIKALETFKGFDMVNEKHRKPVKNYMKGNIYSVHKVFGEQCVAGKIAEKSNSESEEEKEAKVKSKVLKEAADAEKKASSRR